MKPAPAPLVTVAELLAAGVRLEWFDAVAIVAALCDAVVETADHRAPLSLEQVAIEPAGGVIAIVGVQSPQALVQQAAGVLSELLPDFHRQLTFKDVLAGASDTPPRYATVHALAAALAPFERPHREEIIRDVYRRWQAGSSAARPAPPPVVKLPDSGAQRTVAASAAKPKKARRLPVRQFAAVLAIAAIAAGGFFLIRWAPRLLGTTKRARLSAAQVEQSPDEGAPTEQARSTPDTVASGSPDAPTSALAPKEFSPRRPAAAASGATRTTQSTPGRSDPANESAGPRRPDIATPAVPIEPRPDPTAGSAPGLRSSGDSDADHVYAAGDRDVTPPTLSSPQQLWAVPPASTDAERVAIEVLLDERGDVESVRSLRRPENLTQLSALAMSLSAVKSWHFNPALKDGRAVKYRQILWIALR